MQGMRQAVILLCTNRSSHRNQCHMVYLHHRDDAQRLTCQILTFFWWKVFYVSKVWLWLIAKKAQVEIYGGRLIKIMKCSMSCWQARPQISPGGGSCKCSQQWGFLLPCSLLFCSSYLVTTVAEGFLESCLCSSFWELLRDSLRSRMASSQCQTCSQNLQAFTTGGKGIGI